MATTKGARPCLHDSAKEEIQEPSDSASKAKGYESEDPKADWQRFKEAVGILVRTPKDTISKAPKEASDERAEKGFEGKTK